MNLKKLTNSPAIFFLSIFLAGCFSNIQLQLQQVETVMQNRPDSAFRLLQHITLPKKADDSERALYYFLLTEAADKTCRPYVSDSLIGQAISIFEQKGDLPHLAKAYYYKARIEKQKQPEKAVVSLKIAASLAKIQSDTLLARQTESESGKLHIKSPVIDCKIIQDSSRKSKRILIISFISGIGCLLLLLLYRKYRKETVIYKQKARNTDEVNRNLQERLLQENPLIHKIISWETQTAKPLSEEEWKELFVTTDLLFGQYLTRLKGSYPSLTTNDLKLCCLIRLKISPKVIAKIQTVSDNSIYKAFYRIKIHKIGLSSNSENLETFLCSF